MNSFDEKQPEENDPAYEELLRLLQHANLDALFVDPHDQTQALSKVRARLFPTDYEVAQPDAQETQDLGFLPNAPKAQKSARYKRSRRLLHLLNMLAAVLVVAALIGSALLLFGPWSPLHQGAQSHGLEMTMRIPPGPYFMSEMLAVEVSITNHTQTTFRIQGLQESYCAGPLNAVVTGGESPHDTNLKNTLAAMDSCIGEVDGVLKPNETATNTQYVVLTSSGHVTLTAKATFPESIPLAGPFIGSPPSLQITVQTQVPPDRSITVYFQGGQFHVDAPSAARDQLLYKFISRCSPTGGPSAGRWIRLPAPTMQPPDCGAHSIDRGPSIPNQLLWWTYVVGAPGYATVSGKMNLQ